MKFVKEAESLDAIKETQAEQREARKRKSTQNVLVFSKRKTSVDALHYERGMM